MFSKKYLKVKTDNNTQCGSRTTTSNLSLKKKNHQMDPKHEKDKMRVL